MHKIWHRPHVPHEILPLTSLRGLAAILVVLCHIPIPTDLSMNYPMLRALVEFGWFGVPLYFVLSGYLITKLALDEKSKFGQLSLKFFFIRRIFRIWPIYFLGCFLGLWAWYVPCLHEISASPQYLFPFITFTTNIAMMQNIGQVGAMGMLWTLALEEQFYVFWGITLKMLDQKIKLLSVALIVISACMLWRVFPLPFQTFIEYRIQLPISFVSILVGCVIALILPRITPHQEKLKPILLTIAFIGTFVLIKLCATLPTQRLDCLKLITIADLLALTYLILGCWHVSPFIKIFDRPFLRTLGDLSLASYFINLPAIYLYGRWIEPRFSGYIFHPWFAYLLEIILIYNIVFGLSYLWHTLEKPIYDLRHHFRPKHEENTTQKIELMRHI